MRRLFWTCDTRANAILRPLKYGHAWMRTAWWKKTDALVMMIDPNNQTRWKHTWSWHNRGRVWEGRQSGAKREKMSACGGQERLRNTRNDECEGLGRTQAQNWRSDIKSKKGTKNIGSALHIHCLTHRMHYCTFVRRQLGGWEMDQWTFRDGKEVQYRQKSGSFKNIAFVV